MTENPCECKDPGFCLRYNRQMNQRLHQICQGEVLTPEKCEAYRQFWLSQRKTGLGDVVHTIAKVTGAAAVAINISHWSANEVSRCYRDALVHARA